MANLTTTFDIVSAVLSSAGELIDRGGVSDYEAKALEYVNKTYLAVLAGSSEWGIQLAEPFSWAKAKYPGVFNLGLPITGTADLTNGSSAGTFGVAPTVSVQDRYLRVPGRYEWFRIASHTANQTNFTLDAAYTDDTGTGLSIEIDQIDYSLSSGILRLLSPFKVYKVQTVEADDRGVIEGIDLKTLNTDYPQHRIVNGIPTKFAIKYKDTATNTPIIRVDRVLTTQTARVEYDYIPYPTALIDDPSSIPVLPQEHRSVLWYGATYYLMVDKSDNKAEEYKGLCAAGLKAMVEADKKERLNISRRNLGRLVPRKDLQSENVRRYIVQEVIP